MERNQVIPSVLLRWYEIQKVTYLKLQSRVVCLQRRLAQRRLPFALPWVKDALRESQGSATAFPLEAQKLMFEKKGPTFPILVNPAFPELPKEYFSRNVTLTSTVLALGGFCSYELSLSGSCSLWYQGSWC